MPDGSDVTEKLPSVEQQPLSAWVGEPLTDDSREAYFQAVLDRQKGVLDDAASVRRLGMICGSTGLIAAVIMALGSTAVYMKTPVPDPPGYILIDKNDGLINQPVSAAQAPTLFTEMSREHALRGFIIACENYVPETFLVTDWHACMIQATPEEQKVIGADIGPKGPRDPAVIFGGPGKPQATITRFTEFKNEGETGVPPNQTFHYQVRYERLEVINGKEHRPHYTAHVYFQFHPELRETPNDRLINPYGLQVISFSTTPD